MNTNTFYKRLQALTTKEGKIKLRHERAIWKLLNYPPKKIYPRQWIRTGRHCKLCDHTAYYIEIFDALELSYTTGNDAPRGGQNGFFILLTSEELRKLPNLSTLNYDALMKEKINDLIK